jgi:hypothetical protein
MKGVCGASPLHPEQRLLFTDAWTGRCVDGPMRIGTTRPLSHGFPAGRVSGLVSVQPVFHFDFKLLTLVVRLLVKLRAVAAVESDLINGPKQHSNKKKQRKRSHGAHLNGCRMIGQSTHEGLLGSGGACLSAIGPGNGWECAVKPLSWARIYAAHTEC